MISRSIWGIAILLLPGIGLNAQLLTPEELQNAYEYGIRDVINDESEVVRLRITQVYDFSFKKEDQARRIRELLGNIDRFRNLQSLDISYLDSGFISAIDSALRKIGRLKKLQEFSLEQYDIDYFPQELFSLPSLRMLSLAVNVGKLPDQIGSLHGLEVLRMSAMPFLELPASFGSLQNLKKLSLDRCYNLEAFPEVICSLPNLEELSIENDRIESLPESFGSLTRLRRMYVTLQNLNSLPGSIGRLTALEDFYLESSVSKLPESFSALRGLKNLTIFGADNLDLAGACKILARMDSLYELNLPYSGRTHLPPEIGLLKNLASLGLDSWGSLTFDSLPGTISEMKNLRWLHLNSSGITEADTLRLRRILPVCNFDFEIRYCFDENTRITLSDGSAKPIARLRKGEMIRSVDPVTGKPSLSHVDSLFSFGHRKFSMCFVEVEYAAGAGSMKYSRLSVTDEHPFFSAGEWKTLKELRPGDEIMAWYEGKPVKGKILSILPEEIKRFRVYNLRSSSHTFFANDILVHNK